ncbi:MAG: rhomboid family intramembrane serine protease [Bacteroidetes bacterium]|nr:rhomboid family intramembrane serine protease [Bacteroidota bacterium]
MSETDPEIFDEDAFYRKKLLLSIIIPGIFISLMWLVKIIEVLFEIDFSGFGIYPLTVRGLPGIIFSPFIHADINHLFNNSLPLFFLSVALFYFYSEVAMKVFTWTFFLTGLFVWIAGREAWHIGASGLVYGLASFLFFSGIIRRYFRLIALSLLIVFLYGSMVWGIFPGIYKNVSWESHMLGFFSGVVLAVWYRKEGPQKPVYEWMEEEEKKAKGLNEDN